MTPPPGFHHGAVVARIASLLDAFIEKRRLGWVVVDAAVRLGPDTCLAPDVAFLSLAGADRRRKTHLVGAPDLAVEVLSPSTRSFDVGPKLSLYRSAGVREYWLVDPERRTLERHDLERGRKRTIRTLVRSRVLPGLSVDLARVFSVLDDADRP